jgi:putative transposase
MKLTKLQIQESISKLLSEDNGLNEVLQMTLNGMMYSERSHFLSSEDQKRNKGNGYRYAKALGFGKQISLSIPRDRLGVFEPVILALIREQNELLRELSFELYSKGLTTRQIGDITDKIYGKHYSKSAVSAITQEFSQHMQQWRERSLEKRYLAVYIDALHVKVRRERVSSEAFYIILGVREDYKREVLSVVNIPTESATGWQEVVKDLKLRGVEEIELFISDGLNGGQVKYMGEKKSLSKDFSYSEKKKINVADSSLCSSECL